MSRFDGARQGIGAWLIGLIVTVVLAVAGALLGAEYNVLERLNLPALPVGDSELATGGAIALAVVLAGLSGGRDRRRQGGRARTTARSIAPGSWTESPARRVSGIRRGWVGESS